MQFRDHPAVEAKRDYYLVDPRKLKVDPDYNVRDYASEATTAHIENLAASIAENGVRVPLEVRLRENDLVVVSGHCRLRAALLAIKGGAKIDAVPVMPEIKTQTDVERALNLALHNGGLPLAPAEKAKVVQRLLTAGWSREECAKRLGYKSVQPILDMEALLGAPGDVQRMVNDGEVSPSLAAVQIRREGAAAGETLRKAKAHGKRNKKTGKVKITAKAVRKATGAVSLTPKQQREAVSALKAIAKNEGEPKSAIRAARALSVCGVV